MLKQKKGYGKPSYKRTRSGLEEKIKKDLDEKGIDYGYETIKLKYIKERCSKCGEVVRVGTYTPDFIIQRTSGIRLVVESKGRFTGSDRTKMQRVKRDNPTEDIRLVFQRDQVIRKGSTTKYGDWAAKNGFQYAIGEAIPKGWLKDAAQKQK